MSIQGFINQIKLRDKEISQWEKDFIEQNSRTNEIIKDKDKEIEKLRAENLRLSNVFDNSIPMSDYLMVVEKYRQSKILLELSISFINVFTNNSLMVSGDRIILNKLIKDVNEVLK
jgi:hypothetical protein